MKLVLTKINGTLHVEVIACNGVKLHGQELASIFADCLEESPERHNELVQEVDDLYEDVTTYFGTNMPRVAQ